MLHFAQLTGASVGDRIRSALRFRGITQRELAERVGLTEQAISRYVHGSRTPLPKYLSRISRALDIPYDHLLHGSPEIGRSEIEDALALIRRNLPYITNEDRREFVEILCGLKTEADIVEKYGLEEKHP